MQEYLLEIGPSIVPALTIRLKEPDTGVREGVAEVLGALGDRRTASPLLEPLTKDRDRGVAETAVAAIERIKMRQ